MRMHTIEELYKVFLLSEGITTDSRTRGNNKIFFALKGERFNGNVFAPQALKNGCRLAVVDDPGYVAGDDYFPVNDTLQCLQELAAFHRQKKKIPLLAITGSNGKTTTRELITSVLSKKYKVLSTQGNLNNHIGVPLTLLNIRDHEMAVVELGANHPGEIRKLCEIALPDFGIITNIGKAHLEGFGTMDKLIHTKRELYQYLQKHNGSIFVNFNDPVLKKITEKNFPDKIIYGNHPDSVCQGKITGDELMVKASVTWNHEHRKGIAGIQTKLTGAYNLDNILASFTVGLFFNVEENDIADAIRTYVPANNRSQLVTTSLNNTIILDAYNANPTSMHNALMNFVTRRNSNKTAILGDMLELGEYSSREHEILIDILKEHKNISAFLVGREFMRADKNNEFKTFKDTDQLNSYLKANPVSGHLILIKGSRAIRLEEVVVQL